MKVTTYSIVHTPKMQENALTEIHLIQKSTSALVLWILSRPILYCAVSVISPASYIPFINIYILARQKAPQRPLDPVWVSHSIPIYHGHPPYSPFLVCVRRRRLIHVITLWITKSYLYYYHALAMALTVLHSCLSCHSPPLIIGLDGGSKVQ